MDAICDFADTHTKLFVSIVGVLGFVLVLGYINIIEVTSTYEMPRDLVLGRSAHNSSP